MGVINNFKDERKTSYFIEANDGDWQRLVMASPGNSYRTGEVFNAGYETIYAQPKPISKTKTGIPERLIKLKIEREIDKAQFNTLSKLINLNDFKRLKARAPKNLVERIFQPISVERKPFIVRKWNSPFEDFKQASKNRGNAKSVTQAKIASP